MTMNINGTRPAPLPVRDTLTDRTGALLDEYDSAITDLDAATRDAATARLTLYDAEVDMSVIEARAVLAVNGSNAEQRKAAVTLALHEDGDWQDLSRTALGGRSAGWRVGTLGLPAFARRE
jgi:hypothetical protein